MKELRFKVTSLKEAKIEKEVAKET